MKALVYTAPRRVEIQDLPAPQPKPNEVLLRVRAVGICGSDLDGFLGKSRKRIPPLVLGHEFSGEIVQVGDEVRNFRVGDAVAVFPLVACGECRYCRADRHQICPNRKVYGLDFHGGLAEYVSAPGQCLFRMPRGMSYLEGALVEPLANAIHALERCSPVKGRTGLVYGAGPIGMLAFWVAKHFGARRVAVVDLNAHRLARLEELGADRVIDATQKDPVKSMAEWTEGQGVDFAVDAVGEAICRQNVVACLAPGGIAVWIGLSGDLCEMDARTIVTREIEIRGSYAYGLADFRRAMSIMEQKIFPATPFVSERKVEDGQAIFEELTSGHSSLMKTVFRF